MISTRVRRPLGPWTWVPMFLALAVTPIAAQDDGLSENDLFFEEIASVYAASKYEQPLDEAPSQVTIVTEQEIRRYGYRTLADVLNSVRSFYTTNDRNYSYAGVRGFGRPGDYNTRILLMINGQRINDNIYSAVAIDGEFQLNLDTVRQIEIIRGPGSSLYGTNAFFAVINVVTKRGRDLKGLRASAEVGSYGAAGPSFSYGNRFGNGVEVFASASVFDVDGHDELYYREFDDPATNNGVARNVDGEDTENYFASVSWRDLSFQAIYQSREKIVPTGSYDTVFNDPRNRTLDRTTHLNVQYDRTLPSSMALTARLQYHTYTYDGGYAYDWADPGDPPDVVVNVDGSRGAWWTADFQAERSLGNRHRVIAGFELNRSIKQDQFNYDEEVYLDDSRRDDNWGMFLQDEVALSKTLILNVGARYDRYDSFGGEANPRLALLYSPTETTTIKTMVGTAFRAPNAYELYYHDGFSFQKPALDLEPERITTYEVAVERQLADHLRGTVGVYHYTIDDLINQFEDPADGLLVFRNIDEVEADGIEVELEGRWASVLDGRLSYTYQQTEDTATGQQLSNSPEHLAKLALFVPLLDGKANVGADIRYTGSRDDLDGVSRGSHLVTNLTASTRRFFDRIALSLTVYNLFDEDYADVVSDELAQPVIEQDGRSVRLRLSYDF